MKLFLPTFLTAIILAGCEPTREFVKPGATKEETWLDFRECAEQSIKDPTNAARAKACGYGDGDPFFRCPSEVREGIQSHTNRCMQSRGYTVEY